MENCTTITVYFVNNHIAGVSCCLGTLFLVAGILVVVSFRGFVQSLIMAEIPLLPDSQVPIDNWTLGELVPAITVY